jgi:hypothetical protein
VVPGVAQAAAGDTFSCRASALRVSTLINLEPFVANAQQTPCATASSGLIPPTNVGPVTVSVLTANTSTATGAGAASSVATVRISLAPVALLGITVIDAQILSTTAGASCANGYPVFNSSSTIAKLTINGSQVLNLNQPGTIGLLIGTVYLNENVVSATSVTRRALRVSVPLLNLNVVVAESTAGVTGNPCFIPPPPQCRDHMDNDGDGKIDYPADPGCDNPDDNDEYNKPACSDMKDNDGDGKIDYPADPGCVSPYDDDEYNKPACSDGNDNDYDNKVDYPADPGCSGPMDDDEYNKPACSDGKDNDADKKMDYPADPGCMNKGDDEEGDGKPKCSDGADNDADAKHDYPADPGCASKSDNDEKG